MWQLSCCKQKLCFAKLALQQQHNLKWRVLPLSVMLLLPSLLPILSQSEQVLAGIPNHASRLVQESSALLCTCTEGLWVIVAQTVVWGRPAAAEAA